jgi:hypothetical protein
MPWNTNPVRCSWLGAHNLIALQLLGLGLVICFLVIRTSRRRRDTLDPEQAMPFSPTAHMSVVEKADTNQDTSAEPPPSGPDDIADPFTDIKFPTTGPVTSGLLAAQVEAVSPDVATGTVANNEQRQDGDQQRFLDQNARSTAGTEDDQITLRRNSYPFDEHISGPLRDNSSYDQTELFVDHEQQGKIWRRRTLIFETRP